MAASGEWIVEAVRSGDHVLGWYVVDGFTGHKIAGSPVGPNAFDLRVARLTAAAPRLLRACRIALDAADGEVRDELEGAIAVATERGSHA